VDRGDNQSCWNGSSSLPVAVAANRKQARTEEFWACATIHRSFERIQAIDLSFRLTVAPRFSDRISHRDDVSLERASKTLHRVKAGFLRLFQPDAELANTLAFEQAPKSHGESTHCGELWPVLFHRVDFCSFIGGQQSARLDAKRHSHNRRDRTSSRGIGTVKLTGAVMLLEEAAASAGTASPNAI